MADIIEFLRGNGTDFKGRMLRSLVAATDEELERSHDYIQWMFPSDIPSQCNDHAPVLTPEQIAVLRADVVVLQNIELNLLRMLQFYANEDWITPRNHNFLRITRILRCLWLSGLVERYHQFQTALDRIYSKHSETIGERTRQFWKNANNDDFFKT